MTELLVRNRVKDYSQWKRVFDAQDEAARQAGLHLKQMWTSRNDPHNVFFLFEVESVERATAYMADPASAEVGVRAGVLDGDVWFLEEPPED